MVKQGKISPLSIRLIGAIVSSIGFFLTAYRSNIIGSALVGIGAVIIAVGEKW